MPVRGVISSRIGGPRSLIRALEDTLRAWPDGLPLAQFPLLEMSPVVVLGLALARKALVGWGDL